MNNEMDKNLVDDVLSMICQREKPVLVSDLIDGLRRPGGFRVRMPKPESGRSWIIRSNVYEFADQLCDAGFVIRKRRHGAGLCVYVHVENFLEVMDCRHRKMVPVY